MRMHGMCWEAELRVQTSMSNWPPAQRIPTSCPGPRQDASADHMTLTAFHWGGKGDPPGVRCCWRCPQVPCVCQKAPGVQQQSHLATCGMLPMPAQQIWQLSIIARVHLCLAQELASLESIERRMSAIDVKPPPHRTHAKKSTCECFAECGQLMKVTCCSHWHLPPLAAELASLHRAGAISEQTHLVPSWCQHLP